MQRYSSHIPSGIRSLNGPFTQCLGYFLLHTVNDAITGTEKVYPGTIYYSSMETRTSITVHLTGHRRHDLPFFEQGLELSTNLTIRVRTARFTHLLAPHSCWFWRADKESNSVLRFWRPFAYLRPRLSSYCPLQCCEVGYELPLRQGFSSLSGVPLRLGAISPRVDSGFRPLIPLSRSLFSLDAFSRILLVGFSSFTGISPRFLGLSLLVGTLLCVLNPLLSLSF